MCINKYLLEEFNNLGVKIQKYYIKPNSVETVKYNNGYLTVVTKNNKLYHCKIKNIILSGDISKPIVCT